MKRRLVALVIAGTLALPTAALTPAAQAADASTITVRAGGGTLGHGAALIPDGTDALDADITGPPGPLAIQGENTYLYVSADRSVYRIDSEDKFHRIAGNGTSGIPVLGQPALEQPLVPVESITVTPNGTVYLATGVRVLAIQTDGTLVGVTADLAGSTAFTEGMLAADLRATKPRLTSTSAGRVLIGSAESLRWFDPVTKTLTSLTESIEHDPVADYVYTITALSVRADGKIVVGTHHDLRTVDPDTAATTVVAHGTSFVRDVVGLADGRFVFSAGAGLSVSDGIRETLRKWSHAGVYAGTPPTTGDTYAESTLGSTSSLIAVGDRVLVSSSVTADGYVSGRLIEISAVDPPPFAPTFAASVTRPAGSSTATVTWNADVLPPGAVVHIAHAVGAPVEHHVIAGSPWTGQIAASLGTYAVQLATSVERERFFTVFVRDETGLSQRFLDVTLDGWSAIPATVAAPNLVSMTAAVNGWRPNRVSAVFAGVEPGPVQCRIDAGPWTACVDGRITTPALAHGAHTLSARMAYPGVPAGPARSVTFKVDGADPSVTLAKSAAFTKSSSVTAKWTGKDQGTGVGTYRVAVRRFGTGAKDAAWTYPAALSALTKSSTSVSVPRGTTTCWKVGARDKIGNWGGWSAQKCTASLFDERGVKHSKGWAKKKAKKAFLGTYLQTKKNRASSTLPKTYGGQVAVVVTTCPKCGTIDYFVNGKFMGIIDTYSSKTRYGVVKTFRTKPKGKAVTVKIVASTYGQVPVKIEGFGVHRY